MKPHLEIKKYLDTFLEGFNYTQHLSSDPALFMHRYSPACDQEVVAFLSSSLAYGHVEKILEFLNRVFEILGPSPYQFILEFDPKRDRKLFHHLVYRFHRGRHIACLIYLVSQVLKKYHSLEKFFLKFYS
ncbi:MAG: DUF2400 family protein [Chlamydiae bacterium]|nr:DUF2400 family protein [Chlamydiota bacterium]MBI3267278.1 DUF2400 family protein [Chlamydiota bacterium]